MTSFTNINASVLKRQYWFELCRTRWEWHSKRN